MRQLDEWPHKWFGIWREMGPNYASCPSIYDWVNPEESSNYKDDLERILIYLRTATVIAATSAATFPNIFTGENKYGSVSFRTDGIWLWLDNLACYVEQNEIVLPRNFYLHIKGQSYIPPDTSGVKPEELDWPKI